MAKLNFPKTILRQQAQRILRNWETGPKNDDLNNAELYPALTGLQRERFLKHYEFISEKLMELLGDKPSNVNIITRIGAALQNETSLSLPGVMKIVENQWTPTTKDDGKFLLVTLAMDLTCSYLAIHTNTLDEEIYNDAVRKDRPAILDRIAEEHFLARLTKQARARAQTPSNPLPFEVTPHAQLARLSPEDLAAFPVLTMPQGGPRAPRVEEARAESQPEPAHPAPVVQDVIPRKGTRYRALFEESIHTNTVALLNAMREEKLPPDSLEAEIYPEVKDRQNFRTLMAASIENLTKNQEPFTLDDLLTFAHDHIAYKNLPVGKPQEYVDHTITDYFITAQYDADVETLKVKEGYRSSLLNLMITPIQPDQLSSASDGEERREQQAILNALRLVQKAPSGDLALSELVNALHAQDSFSQLDASHQQRLTDRLWQYFKDAIRVEQENTRQIITNVSDVIDNVEPQGQLANAPDISRKPS